MAKHIWLAALALAGCEQAAVKETAQPPVAQAPAPAALPAPSVTPAAAPVLTAEGYGRLRIGMSRAEVEAAMGADSNPQAVGGPEPEMCDQFRPARAPQGLLAMVENGRLTRLSATDPAAALRTEHGIALGDSAAAVRSKLGARVRAEPHKYSDPPAEYLTWWARGGPAPGAAYAEDERSRGIRYEIGMKGEVAAIHVGGPSIEYVEGCL